MTYPRRAWAIAFAVALAVSGAVLGNYPRWVSNAVRGRSERFGSERYRTEDFPIRSARDFVFYKSSDDWEAGGYWVTSVDAEGNVIHVIPDRTITPTGILVEWRRGSFRLAPRELEELKALLVAIRFPELSEEYVNVLLEDGWRAITTVIAGGKRKSVFTKNWAPKEIEYLNEWLNKHFSRAPERRPEDYSVISYEEAERYWRQRP